ncbi:hypothetical protein [Chitinophaga filiformis]|uniref:Exo-alpha-sialidase n=1 Tax=Chitinophaga filiformis TaxID=104663 RepID=A0ABY4I642_CHIFI|nr:hypothetical protein [Chitinophaga filiformis]UPK70739.1 hypothetical protein MYF79_05435 [Chitinophaga filiformis]
MPLNRMHLLTVLMLIILGCGKDKNKKDSRILSYQKIWSNSTYSAFTDLTKYGGRWYCVFREGKAHVGDEGKVRLISSDDAITWSSDTLLRVPGSDLRDPKLIIGFDHKLYITVGALRPGNVINVVYAYNDTTGRWKGPINTNVDKDWLWRVQKRGNTDMYTMAYGVASRQPMKTTISLYGSNPDIFPRFRLLKKDVSSDGCPTECAMLFTHTKKMVIVARRDCDSKTSWLGLSDTPYNVIEWHDMGRTIESPNIIEVKNRFYLAGRAYDPPYFGPVTALFDLDIEHKKVTKLENLPSGWDTGYPGLYYNDGKLWISYYAKDVDESRSIFLCTYKTD